jgi:hypothetical protein
LDCNYYLWGGLFGGDFPFGGLFFWTENLTQGEAQGQILYCYICFTYDTCTHGVGRLCTAADATGTTSYSYSPEGWLTGRGFSISGTTYSLGYGYNALGQVASVGRR